MTPAEWGRKADWWMEYVVIPIWFTAVTVWFVLVVVVFVAWMTTEIIP